MSERKSRKEFIRAAGLITFGAVLFKDVVFGSNLPTEYELILEGDDLQSLKKSPQLTVLNSRPWNVETPAHLLDDKITPSDKFFVRNNGIPPSSVDLESWTLTIEGESVVKPVTLSLAELKSKFKQYSYQLTVECGGNGRYEFNPPAKGNQWTVGAVGCPVWNGIRLKDVLEYAGIKPDAVYIGYYGKDTHLSGDANAVVISRGVPIEKALEDESMIAWGMNGEPLPFMNGYPLRLVFGGWPASTSGKWLHKIVIRNKVHDGAKMEGESYRLPCEPVEPGSKVADENMCIIESMPVKSVITHPKTGAMIKKGSSVEFRGHAWAGDLSVREMHVSVDFGATWTKCTLDPPANRLAWQNWRSKINLPEKGYYEVWAKATDDQGKQQPMVVPGWNPKGYLNNACHRIAIKVI